MPLLPGCLCCAQECDCWQPSAGFTRRTLGRSYTFSESPRVKWRWDPVTGFKTLPVGQSGSQACYFKRNTHSGCAHPADFFSASWLVSNTIGGSACGIFFGDFYRFGIDWANGAQAFYEPCDANGASAGSRVYTTRPDYCPPPATPSGSALALSVRILGNQGLNSTSLDFEMWVGSQYVLWKQGIEASFGDYFTFGVFGQSGAQLAPQVVSCGCDSGWPAGCYTVPFAPYCCPSCVTGSNYLRQAMPPSWTASLSGIGDLTTDGLVPCVSSINGSWPLRQNSFGGGQNLTISGEDPYRTDWASNPPTVCRGSTSDYPTSSPSSILFGNQPCGCVATALGGTGSIIGLGVGQPAAVTAAGCLAWVQLGTNFGAPAVYYYLAQSQWSCYEANTLSRIGPANIMAQCRNVGSVPLVNQNFMGPFPSTLTFTPVWDWL